MLTRDKFLWFGLLIFGIYGAYALGANNVANATGVFSKHFVGVSDSDLALYGGIAIATGAMICGKRIMMAVGSDIMKLNSFTALISVMASSITIHFFAFVGVPVSSNQALVGAIVGIGLLRNPQGLHFSYIKNLALGWLFTPLAALILSAAGYALF
jgi:PiT family inorganic phosphate transporter